MFKRSSGVLLHVSSLPSEFGIGDFGPSAYRFVDFLKSAGQHCWQILPLNPTDAVYGSSPYSSISAFAVNTLFISPELLRQEGWLTADELKIRPDFSDSKVNYETVQEYKATLFAQAFACFFGQKKRQKEYQTFCREQAFWLDDYVLFAVLKRHFAGAIWNRWPTEFVSRNPAFLNKFSSQHQAELDQLKFLQYVAFVQWRELRRYANQHGVALVGDIPIYVNFDSADVWGSPRFFKLNDRCDPVFVAGVPPDYFSVTGQRWGNPVYDWAALKADGYAWWLRRIKHNLSLFDYIRIDHFRGLVAFWQIPAEEKTAVKGEWVAVPVDDFLSTVAKSFAHLPIVAEDLGIITPDVTAVMEKFGLPGMKILLFAFGGEMKTHPYIPENYSSHCVVYTGTHDNNTVRGWVEHDASAHEKQNLAAYLGRPVAPQDLPWALAQVAMRSKAVWAVLPMQDLLGLGAEARMNVPSTTLGNWQWRARPADFSQPLAQSLRQLTVQSDRLSP